jgi:hypothetical protein
MWGCENLQSLGVVRQYRSRGLDFIDVDDSDK